MDGNFGLKKLRTSTASRNPRSGNARHGGLEMLKESCAATEFPSSWSVHTVPKSVGHPASAFDGSFRFRCQANDVSARMPQIAQELITKIKAAAQSRGGKMRPVPDILHERKKPCPTPASWFRELCHWGFYGGPHALQYVLSQLPADFPEAFSSATYA